jgi:threonine/homoserine/homoserine lactone efflux protein
MEVVLGMVIAIAYGISPGPVNIETVRRGWTSGVQGALLFQLGALLGDLIYAVLALAGIGLFVAQAGAQILLGIAGTSLLLYLGGSSLRQSWYGTGIPTASASSVARPATKRCDFSTGMVIAIANPYAMLFWLSIDGTMLQSTDYYAATFLGGFFLGGLLVALVIALLAGRSGSLITPRVSRLASCSFGLILVGFGLTLGYATVLRF